MKKVVIVAIFVISVLTAGSVTLVSAEPKEFKLGSIVPMTGPASHIGQRMKHSFMMATEEINKKGGVLGMQVKLIEWDGMADPERAVTGAKKLIESDGVWGLIGIFRSGAALAVADVAAAQKKILMVTNANSPAITALVKKDYNKYKYIFRPAATAIHFTDSVIPFITGIAKAKTYFYIAENTTYARDAFAAMEVALTPIGIKCVGKAYADVSASEFMGELAQIRSVKPDVVVVAFPTAAGVAFQKQYYDKKMGIPHVSLPGVMSMLEVATEIREKSDHAAFVSFCWDVPITDKTIPFYEKFKKSFGYFPEGYCDVRAYDGMYILADAINRAGSLDVEKVIGALEKTDYKGVAGRYVFDDSHQSKWGAGYLVNIIGQWINGKGYIIWPPAYANATYKKDPR